MGPAAWAGALLAGGRARRMGRDKLALRLPDGRRLVDVPAEALHRVITHRGGACAWVAPEAPARLPDGFVHVADCPDGPARGPLAGLAAALAWAEARGATRLLVVAGDLPAIRAAHLHRLVSQAEEGTGGALLARGPDGRAEPLIGVYPSSWATRARALLAAGEAAVHTLSDGARQTVEIDPKSAQVTPSMTESGAGRDRIHACFNLNRPEDWQQLLRSGDEGRTRDA